jgi:hypothetical protein
MAADTFGVGIRVTADAFEFLVRVPSEIDSGWTDPDAFQDLVESVVWDRLDRTETLRAVDRVADAGTTVSLGTVTLDPDGTVVEADLSAPAPAQGAEDP